MTDVLHALESPRGITRRGAIGILVAAPTLVAAARWGVAPAQAAIPTTQQPVDSYDLSDLLTDAARPTFGLITVTVNPDGTASFELPRAEVGQGLTTSFAMVIADEMELPLDKVHVTLADAKPELVFNQLTGGSHSLPPPPPPRRPEPEPPPPRAPPRGPGEPAGPPRGAPPPPSRRRRVRARAS